MKKISLFTLTVLMLILSACGGNVAPANNGGESEVATIVAGTLAAIPTSAPVVEQTAVPSAKLEDFPNKEFIGENERFSVFLINPSGDPAEKVGQILVYNKGTAAVSEIVGTFRLAGTTIVYNDDKGEYVLLSAGTYTSRTAIVISLADKKQAVNDFCISSGEAGSHFFWDGYVIYNNCDKFSNRPWGAGEAPSIVAVNLKTGALTDIAKSDLLRQFNVKEVAGSALQYVETSVSTEADWQNPTMQKQNILSFDLSTLGK